MISTPSLKAQYEVRYQKDEGVFLLSEFGNYILHGKAYEMLIPLIDGHRSNEDIVTLLEDKISKEEIIYALLRLEKDGHILEADDSLPISEAAFWNAINVNTNELKSLAESFPISIESLGNEDSSNIESIIKETGFKVKKKGKITLVLTNDYLNKGLISFNKKALKENITWLPIKAKGGVIWIGPVFKPGQSACFNCMASRIKANRNIESYLSDEYDIHDVVVSKINSPLTRNTGLNLAITQLYRYLFQPEASILNSHLITCDALNINVAFHRVVKRPQCYACGNLENFQKLISGPITLNEINKSFTRDGGHRQVSPHITYQKFKHHVSAITGVVEYLKPAFHNYEEDRLSFVAGHNFALKSYRSLMMLKQNMRMVSGGKGNSEIQAKTSALCEALERYSGLYQKEEPIIKNKSFNELGEKAIHPDTYLQFSDLQYKERDKWLARGSHFNIVPMPFDSGLKTDWAPIWSMTQQHQKLLPAQLLYYNYPLDPMNSYGFADSNGCAAGNTIEEAILQGFLEIVERDAVGIWWYNRLFRPAVDFDSFQLPEVISLKQKYAQMGREIWVLDLTMDFPIHTFAAFTRNVNSPKEEIVFGFGAHFDAKIALLRAISEMNQFLPWVEKIRNNQIYFDAETSNWFLNATVANQPHLIPFNIPAKKAWEFSNHSHPSSITQDVLLCQKLVEAKGMELLIHNQTRPDIGLNVVKVIVPGMRHFWARYAPGRLFDVPVQLGYLQNPHTESQFNPLCLFI